MADGVRVGEGVGVGVGVGVGEGVETALPAAPQNRNPEHTCDKCAQTDIFLIQQVQRWWSAWAKPFRAGGCHSCMVLARHALKGWDKGLDNGANRREQQRTRDQWWPGWDCACGGAGDGARGPGVGVAQGRERLRRPWALHMLQRAGAPA